PVRSTIWSIRASAFKIASSLAGQIGEERTDFKLKFGHVGGCGASRRRMPWCASYEFSAFGRDLLNIAAWLNQSALVSPGAPALYRGTRLYADYATFAHHSAAIGAYLTDKCGLTAGDRVAIFLH